MAVDADLSGEKNSDLDAPGRGKAARQQRRHRSIFLSDLHLGTRQSRPDLVMSFLARNTADTIYLVGDIVDNWHPLAGNWRADHHAMMRHLLDLPFTGVRVVYVPGNHDAFFRNYVGSTFGGIEVAWKADHVAADGKRYLVTHGDVCDVFSERAPILGRAGCMIERLAWGMDVAQRHIAKRLGLPEWLGIETAIARTNAAIRRHDRFEERLVGLAMQGGYDGIVCGHFHQAALHDDLGAVYANCGDWTGNNTAIVEDFDGQLTLVREAHPLSTHAPRGDGAPADSELSLAR
jgi:UDP-2,3-diacylglucosamine pyrophosphatase LpxH